ncbi:MAG: tryptophan--tRNA ligase [Actinobacteria bacterium RBG_16_64_13]|nr:MAG: tryptophan--tRNA ligase [Actinobacteria bacterium RBG_16_64_13]
MRILSGIQPSGRPHVGNYFGALRQYITLQAGNEPFYFIASYHALTAVQDAPLLREYTVGVALDFLALGLDPQHAALFAQQDVPEVTELAWILSCVTPMGLLERAVSYKDKVAQGLIPNHGLFAYPVLQAADILVYLSDLVPVGQDQKQHLEMTRDIAGKFNQQFGEVFVIPEPYILDSTAVVPGIDGRKMSKSYGNEIGIFDEGSALKKKVMSIVTDSAPVEAPKDPAESTPFLLLSMIASEEETAEWEARYKAGGMGYGEVKKRLLELIDGYFAPFRERRRELEKDPAYVLDVLREGGMRARAVAQQVMRRVREATGLPTTY